jgi:hypothetical protein
MCELAFWERDKMTDEGIKKTLPNEYKRVSPLHLTGKRDVYVGTEIGKTAYNSITERPYQ